MWVTKLFMFLNYKITDHGSDRSWTFKVDNSSVIVTKGIRSIIKHFFSPKGGGWDCSGIEHGGTRTFPLFMAMLAL